MTNTMIQQGRFTSDGKTKTIRLRSDIDWFEVDNVTVASNPQAASRGVKHHWQRGYPDAAKWTTFKTSIANAGNLEKYRTTLGFTLIDSSSLSNGPLLGTITAVSIAAIPVVTNAGANDIIAGDIVRLYNVTAAHQLDGIDFTVGQNTLTGTTFSLDYMQQLGAAGTVAQWRKINVLPEFYPATRTITKVTTGATTTIEFSVVHNYKVGEKVHVHIPSSYGITVNGEVGTIIAVTHTATVNSIVVDIATNGVFTYPASNAGPFLRAQVVPFGTDTAKVLANGSAADTGATVDTGYIGIKLAGGNDNPAGNLNDVIYWRAGKSFSVDNQ